MAEEPLPKDFKAGHDEDDVPPSIPASAEDRKTAAALSSLEARSDEEEGENKANVDTEALGKAMNRLDVKEDGAAKKEEGEKKKAVKLDQEDVQLVITLLDLPKAQATDLLRAHEGDAVKAMNAFVTAAVDRPGSAHV